MPETKATGITVMRADAQRLELRDVQVPRVPAYITEQIGIGVRGSSEGRRRTIRVKKRDIDWLTMMWGTLLNHERLIVAIVSEMRSASERQLASLFADASTTDGRIACSGALHHMAKRFASSIDVEAAFEEVGKDKDRAKEAIDGLVSKGLLSSVYTTPSGPKVWKVAPTLFDRHLFLTENGALMLHAATGVDRSEIGFVPGHSSYSYLSMVHLSECNDLFYSMAMAGAYFMETGAAGLVDIALWEDERRCTHVFQHNGQDVVFKPDAFFALFSDISGGFSKFYVEHDTGSTSKTKTRRKAVAYMQHAITLKKREGDQHANASLLFITQGADRVKMHQKEIDAALKEAFKDAKRLLNAVGKIAVADAKDIKELSPLGEAWNVIDLATGDFAPKKVSLLAM